MSVHVPETNTEAGFRGTVGIRTTTTRRTNRHFLSAWPLGAHGPLESQQALTVQWVHWQVSNINAREQALFPPGPSPYNAFNPSGALTTSLQDLWLRIDLVELVERTNKQLKVIPFRREPP